MTATTETFDVDNSAHLAAARDMAAAMAPLDRTSLAFAQLSRRSRDVEWFFAEPEAARKAGELFGDDQTLQRIKIFVIPAEAP